MRDSREWWVRWINLGKTSLRSLFRLELKSKREEVASHVKIWGKRNQAEGTACAETP